MTLYRHHPVWLIEENCLGEIIKYGAFYSTVKYEVDGIIHEEIIENDGFITIDELGITYESEE